MSGTKKKKESATTLFTWLWSTKVGTKVLLLELDYGARQQHVMGANRGDATMFFNLQLVFTSTRKGILELLRSMRIFLGENYLTCPEKHGVLYTPLVV